MDFFISGNYDRFNIKASRNMGLQSGKASVKIKLYEQHVITESFETFVAAHTCKPDTIWQDISLQRNDVRITRAVGEAAQRAGLDSLETMDLLSAALAVRYLQRSGEGNWQGRNPSISTNYQVLSCLLYIPGNFIGF